MTSAPAIFTVRCHYCSRPRNPTEILKIGTGGVVMCWHCYEWHLKALRMLCGHPPPGCQECGTTFTQLQERAAKYAAVAGDCSMYIHPKDGIYQVLCRACSDRYVPQRVDLYRPTEYGYRKKL